MRRKTVGPSILDETFEEEFEPDKRLRSANRMVGGARKQIVSRNASSGKSEEHLNSTPSLNVQPNLLQPRSVDFK